MEYFMNALTIEEDERSKKTKGRTSTLLRFLNSVWMHWCMFLVLIPWQCLLFNAPQLGLPVQHAMTTPDICVTHPMFTGLDAMVCLCPLPYCRLGVFIRHRYELVQPLASCNFCPSHSTFLTAHDSFTRMPSQNLQRSRTSLQECVRCHWYDM